MVGKNFIFKFDVNEIQMDANELFLSCCHNMESFLLIPQTEIDVDNNINTNTVVVAGMYCRHLAPSLQGNISLEIAGGAPKSSVTLLHTFIT